MTLEISLGGSVDLERVDSMCRALEPLNEISGRTDVHFDLSELDELSPAALAVLLATFQDLHRRGICDVTGCCSSPRGGQLKRWLAPDALKNLLAASAGQGFGVGEDPPGFEGCEPFSDRDGADRAATALLATVGKEGSVDSISQHSMGMMISALTENVLDHSAAGCGMATASANLAKGEIDVAIADRGIGVRQSLSHNVDYGSADDLAALQAAQHAGVTGVPGQKRGYGLFLARCVLYANGGSMMIRSGNAMLVGAQKPEEAKGSEELPVYHGTLVAARIRMDQPFDYGEIDRQLLAASGVPG